MFGCRFANHYWKINYLNHMKCMIWAEQYNRAHGELFSGWNLHNFFPFSPPRCVYFIALLLNNIKRLPMLCACLISTWLYLIFFVIGNGACSFSFFLSFYSVSLGFVCWFEYGRWLWIVLISLLLSSQMAVCVFGAGMGGILGCKAP